MGEPAASDRLTVRDLMPCFGGVVPSVFATISAQGVPNVTYLSRALPVDDGRIALSNQFFSKSHRNLAEHPRACVLLVHPDTHEQFRVLLQFEQTLRRGEMFDRMRNDLALIAALTRMHDVFRLAAADVYRVISIDRVRTPLESSDTPAEPVPTFHADHAALGELCARLSRCSDLDTLVRVLLGGLDELLGFDHSILLLVDESGDRLFTIGSHGYEREGVGAEIEFGDGIAGLTAQRCAPMRTQNTRQMTRYARSVRAGFEATGELAPEREVPMPGLPRPGSQMAAPALTLGELVGVVLVESAAANRFEEVDVATLSIVASLAASVIERLRSEVRDAPARQVATANAAAPPSARPLLVRHFLDDGSTFLDNEYLIKGVAGKLLWAMLTRYQHDARVDFTNREMRLESSLDLPDFRDNFESRLILLKRRLVERGAPLQIVKTGRGRFRLEVDRPLVLDAVG